MKVETIGKYLIAAGAVVGLYAQNMSVSVGNSGIANIHLISERQNTLLFGGILFLAGIILFAVFKLKQTKEEGDIADKLQQERADAAKSFMVATDRRPLSIAVRLALGIVIGAYSVFLTKLVFFATSALAEIYFPIYAEGIGAILTAIAIIAYAFRKISIKKVIIHFAVLAVFATVSIPVLSALRAKAKRDCTTFNTNVMLGREKPDLNKFMEKSIFCLEL
jgi:hypothetical protein